MAEHVNGQEEVAQKPSMEDPIGEADGSSILDQVDDEVEVLEDERIEWTESMMPKFETPPPAGFGQMQAEAEQDPTRGLQPAEESQSDQEDLGHGQSARVDQDQACVTEEHQKGVGSSAMSSGTPASIPAEDVKAVRFPQFAPSPKGEALGNLELLLDVKMPLVVELGRSRMLIRDILELGPGSVIELDRAAGEPVDLLVNGRLIARGEVVVIDENFGLRITELADSAPEVAQ